MKPCQPGTKHKMPADGNSTSLPAHRVAQLGIREALQQVPLLLPGKKAAAVQTTLEATRPWMSCRGLELLWQMSSQAPLQGMGTSDTR